MILSGSRWFHTLSAVGRVLVALVKIAGGSHGSEAPGEATVKGMVSRKEMSEFWV